MYVVKAKILFMFVVDQFSYQVGLIQPKHQYWENKWRIDGHISNTKEENLFQKSSKMLNVIWGPEYLRKERNFFEIIKAEF